MVALCWVFIWISYCLYSTLLFTGQVPYCYSILYRTCRLGCHDESSPNRYNMFSIIRVYTYHNKTLYTYINVCVHKLSVSHSKYLFFFLSDVSKKKNNNKKICVRTSWSWSHIVFLFFGFFLSDLISCIYLKVLWWYTCALEKNFFSINTYIGISKFNDSKPKFILKFNRFVSINGLKKKEASLILKKRVFLVRYWMSLHTEGYKIPNIKRKLRNRLISL